MIDIGQPRWWPLTGILGVALMLVGGSLQGPPGSTASAKDVVSYLQTNQGAIQVGIYIGGLGGMLWLWFSVAFYWVLRKTEVQAVWSLTYFAAVVTLVSVSTALTAPSLILGHASIRTGDPNLALAIANLSSVASLLEVLPLAMLSLSASVLIVRSGIIAKWTGWLGLLSAALQFLTAPSNWFGIAGAPIAGALLYLVWTIAVAIALMRVPAGGPALRPEEAG